MGTKRRPLVRRPQNVEPALTATLREVLLLGWLAPVPKDEDPAVDPFAEFELSDDALCRLWRRHRATLLIEWASRGASGAPFAAQRFDGAAGPYYRPLMRGGSTDER